MMPEQITPPDGSGGSKANAEVQADIQRLLQMAKNYKPPTSPAAIPSRPTPVGGDSAIDAAELSKFQRLTIAWLVAHPGGEAAATAALSGAMLAYPDYVRARALGQTRVAIGVSDIFATNAWKPLAIVVGGALLIALLVDLTSLARR